MVRVMESDSWCLQTVKQRATKEYRDQARHHVTLNSQTRLVGRSPAANVPSQAWKTRVSVSIVSPAQKLRNICTLICAMMMTKRANSISGSRIVIQLLARRNSLFGKRSKIFDDLILDQPSRLRSLRIIVTSEHRCLHNAGTRKRVPGELTQK